MVYVVTDGTGYVKIGSSEMLFGRLVELQTGNPRPISLLRTFETASRSLDYTLEHGLHKRYKHAMVSINGKDSEWFSIDGVGELLDAGRDELEIILNHCGGGKLIKVTKYSTPDQTPIKELSEWLDCKTIAKIEKAWIYTVEELEDKIIRNKNEIGFGIPGVGEKRAEYIRYALKEYHKSMQIHARIIAFQNKEVLNAAK